MLFHGTKRPCAILRTNELLYAPISGNNSISFSRMLHVAVYWARLGVPQQETHGAVLILDRDRLSRDYALRPYQWHLHLSKAADAYEAEEAVFRRGIEHLHRYLIDVLWLPKELNIPRPKARITAKIQKEAGLRPLRGPQKN